MSNILTALIIVISINVMLMLSQAAVLEVNPNAQVFYHGNGSIVCNFETNNCAGGTYQLNDQNPSAQLPSGTGSVSPTTGNLFTDSYTTLKNFFIGVGTGITYLFAILGGPYYFLSILGLPTVITFALGGLWYGITVLLVIAFLMGRND